MPRGLLTYGFGLGWEVEGNARIVTALSIFTSSQQRLASGFKGSMKSGEEFEGTLSEELSLSLRGDIGMDFDAGDGDVGHGVDDEGG